MANGDVPDGSMAHGDGSGSEGDEAAWLDLIAHYDAPAKGGEVPWPERENLAGPVPVTPVDAIPDATTAPEGPALDATPFPDTPSFPTRRGGPGGGR